MEQDSADTLAIIDDDGDVTDALSGLVETMGYRIQTYRSASVFLAAGQFGQLACLIVDQNIPSMTGLAMLEDLSGRGISIPSLPITGTPDAGIERRAAELGVMTVLEKPMSHHELLRFISLSAV